MGLCDPLLGFICSQVSQTQASAVMRPCLVLGSTLQPMLGLLCSQVSQTQASAALHLCLVLGNDRSSPRT
ncbi:hypothetical protein B296_00027762 [Ensete ventricosum]|uniref:Uncharacterized protein n=1 Tax=Ensete ventricosum TaxID=4639 RepID=A0A426YQD6_ENSVE|nr:hypothetical protein B296_00027762 [Ensete ventricosum]